MSLFFLRMRLKKSGMSHFFSKERRKNSKTCSVSQAATNHEKGAEHEMIKRAAEKLPESHGLPAAQKPRLAPSSNLAQQVIHLSARCGAQDKVKQGYFVLVGLTVPIWSPAKVDKYMTTAEMLEASSLLNHGHVYC